MIKGFFNSLRNSSKALSYLFKPWVLKYLVITGFLSLAVAACFFILIYYFGDNLGDLIFSLFAKEDSASAIHSFLNWATRFILWIGVGFIFKYIILIISAPLMSALSEKLEQKITGRAKKQTAKDQLLGISRGIKLSVSNIARELLITVCLLLLSLIPGVAIVTAPLIFITQSYFAGFGNVDFFLERRLNSREARQFAKRNRGLMIGNGLVFLVILLIPILGVFVASTVATISGTLSGLEKLNDQ